MKFFFILFSILSMAAIHAEENTEPLSYVFPSFDKEDIASAVTSFPEPMTYDQMKAFSVIDLRAIMTAGNISDQFQASEELIERNDQKSILRLIYSLKGGNSVAERIMRGHDSLNVLPYLVEDVAHGSIELYEKNPPGGDEAIVGRVRSVAANIVAGTLASSPEITGETRDCLRSISIGSDGGIQTLSEKSRYLIQWWFLNESAIEAGKWADTKPLPQKIGYPSADTVFPSMQPEDSQANSVGKSHILGPSWELPESFEDWSKRIVHPELRNLDFVELSWDGEKVVEHSPKSIDPKRRPKNRQERQSRKSEGRGINSEQKIDNGFVGMISAVPWPAWWAGVLVVLGVVRLLIRRKKKW